MARKRKKSRRTFKSIRLKKPGLPPGSVVFDGQRKVEEVTIDSIHYDAENLIETRITDPSQIDPVRRKPGTMWLDVIGLHDTEMIDSLGGMFDLHPLVREDLVSTGQRPKVEFFDDYVYIVVKMVSWLDDGGLAVEQVSLVVGRGFVLSFQERPGDVFGPVRERLRSALGRIRTLESDYLAYALLDIIVDNYFVVLGSYGDQLDDLEEVILEDPTPENQAHLRDLRRDLITLRRAVWPVREVVASLERTESKLISAEVRPFFRDVNDHAVQILDIVESSRDVVGGLMDLYLSSLSNRMNEIMKVLTLFGTIFLPLSFLTGLYGMNFDDMPELHYRYGYPILLLVMTSVVVGLLYYFKRKNWL
ncbi:MAG: magnesium/cobalt transporter CorA [Rhodothermales bacterium]